MAFERASCASASYITLVSGEVNTIDNIVHSRGCSYLLPLELMLGPQRRKQRLKTFEICRRLYLIVKIILHPGPLMR